MSEKLDMFTAILLHGFITRGENASEKFVAQSLEGAKLMEKALDAEYEKRNLAVDLSKRAEEGRKSAAEAVSGGIISSSTTAIIPPIP